MHTIRNTVTHTVIIHSFTVFSCLFQRIFKELFPYLVETDKKLAVWLLNRQAGIDDLAPVPLDRFMHHILNILKIPRSIGTVAFTLNSVKGQRAAITYSLWMLRSQHFVLLAVL